MEAILKYGCLKGIVLASKRICRCHPWSSGGIDEVPKKL
jgi:putative component of membrane protein insertase Oxa1/YidC/SpoIIIJ protein YidD